jgi:S1-C subfamily serine protease
MLRAYKPGAKPEFDVIRDGQKIKITSTLVVVPKTENQLKVYEDSMLEFKARDIAYLDALKRRWKKDEKGVLVTETDPGGWASVGGLFPDDLILAVDGRAVLNVDDLEQTLEAVQQKKPKQINFLVRRGIHTLFVELEPKWPGKK